MVAGDGSPFESPPADMAVARHSLRDTRIADDETRGCPIPCSVGSTGMRPCRPSGGRGAVEEEARPSRPDDGLRGMTRHSSGECGHHHSRPHSRRTAPRRTCGPERLTRRLAARSHGPSSLSVASSRRMRTSLILSAVVFDETSRSAPTAHRHLDAGRPPPTTMKVSSARRRSHRLSIACSESTSHGLRIAIRVGCPSSQGRDAAFDSSRRNSSRQARERENRTRSDRRWSRDALPRNRRVTSTIRKSKFFCAGRIARAGWATLGSGPRCDLVEQMLNR